MFRGYLSFPLLYVAAQRPRFRPNKGSPITSPWATIPYASIDFKKKKKKKKNLIEDIRKIPGVPFDVFVSDRVPCTRSIM